MERRSTLVQARYTVSRSKLVLPPSSPWQRFFAVDTGQDLFPDSESMSVWLGLCGEAVKPTADDCGWWTNKLGGSPVRVEIDLVYLAPHLHNDTDWY